MKKIFIIVMLLMALNRGNAQQDAQFSQYMFNGMYINPAYCGYREQWNVNAFYRNQWVGFPGAPRTASLAVDGIANDNKVGLGLMIMSDKVGAQTNNSVYGNYAYRIPLSMSAGEQTKTLSLGIGVGVLNSRLDLNELKPDQQNDPSILSAVKSKWIPDARFGVFYNSERFYAGASADNLISNFWRKKDDISGVYVIPKTHWYLTAGGLVPLSEEVLWKPSFLLKDDIAGPTSFDLNSFFLFSNTLWLGASYRTSVPLYNKPAIASSLPKTADLVGLLELMVNDKLRIGYAYDYSLNGTATQGYSTHEISIGYFFPVGKARMFGPRYF